jgi:hypothetical protein
LGAVISNKKGEVRPEGSLTSPAWMLQRYKKIRKLQTFCGLFYAIVHFLCSIPVKFFGK